MREVTTLIITILLSSTTIHGQSIEIGQSANEIKYLIEWRVKDHNRPDSYGRRPNSRASSDVIYNNGEISDVILCFENQYLLDFKTVANFCIHYIIESGKLAYTLTQYENISTSKLTAFYNDNYNDTKYGEFYFSNDYKHYSKIYLAKNQNATIEWRKTDVKSLPLTIRPQVEKKIKENENEKLRQQQEAEEERRKEKEIKSKTYDLAYYDSSKYKYFVAELSYRIAEVLLKPKSFVPDFLTIEQEEKKYFRINNIYNAHYKLVDYSRESVNHGSYIVAGTNDIRSENNFTLISGTDNECRLLKLATVTLPKISIEGYGVMTEATLNNITVDFVKGLSKVKVKNGLVSFVKNPPPLDVQEQLTQKLKTETNGSFYIKYQVGQIMGSPFIAIDKY
jgi:hypothetical protein